MDVKKLFEAKLDRRRVLGNLGMMGAGAVLAACGGVVAQPDPDPDPAEVDKAILNFALNLEYLEAEFYLAAVGRMPAYAGDVGGTVQTNGPANFANAEVEAYANEIADDEEAHVLFLRSALGADAVDRPNMDLRGGPGTAFGLAARAAGEVAGLTGEDLNALEEFNPYLNDLFFLHGAFIFEDVGVTAYKGAAPLVDNADFLGAAAGILAVEAYHASEVRTLLYQDRNTTAIPANFGTHTNQAFDVRTIVGAISGLRAFLGNGKDQSIVSVDGGMDVANIVPADGNAIAFGRTPREVLNIVYGNLDTTPGLFFPNGVNGDFSLLLS